MNSQTDQIKRLSEIDDDLDDVATFPPPSKYFLIRIDVPDDAISHRDAWKLDGKTVRAERYLKDASLWIVRNLFDTIRVPTQWCTVVSEDPDVPERMLETKVNTRYSALIETSLDDDLGDVSEFNAYRDVPTRARWRQPLKNILALLSSEPGWSLLEYFSNSKDEPVVTLINIVTGEIRQHIGIYGDLIFSAFDELGLLELDRDASDFTGSTDYARYRIRPPKKENRMKNTAQRWHEVNEINPESGYIREIPDQDEDLGSIENFETPMQANASDLILKQPNYFAALEAFSNIYEGKSGHDTGTVEVVLRHIPHGSGAFEAWWVGAAPDKPGDIPSPRRTITKEDIDKLYTYNSQMQGNGVEVLGLFTNCFYNTRVGKMMDLSTLEYLVKRALRVASYFDGQELLEMEFTSVFENMDDEEKEDFWESPSAQALAAKTIAREIKSK